MEPVFLTKLVSHNNDWLSVRQATIAENIANSNTPGFPFQGPSSPSPPSSARPSWQWLRPIPDILGR